MINRIPNRIVFQNELYMARRTLVAGSAGIVTLMAIFGGLSGLVIDSETGDLLVQLMANFPSALLDAFNFNIDSLQSYEGWMASEPYTFYVLILGIMAANGAAAVVSREMDQGTIEAVVSLPIGRTALFLSKVAAHVVNLTIMAMAGIVAALLAGYFSVGVEAPGKIVILLVAGYVTTLAFAGIAYAVSPLLDAERTAASVGATIVLGSFVIDILSTFSDKLAWLARFSLFSLFDVHAMMGTGTLPFWPSVTALSLLAAGVAVGATLFNRKQIAV